ncbi:MAG: HEPN domain-containing protein [Candidatus Cloacimonetes bacterium]|nr:HEPN domain-containing protein [Candidatus Cloacimonadota bacterium]
MTLEAKDREELIKYRIERAKDSINDVQFLIENNKLTLAVNRIYYGIFYILSALSLKHKFITSKHSQLLGWFNKTFVKEGIIDKKYGRFIHEAYDKRSKGDYDDFVTFSRDEVKGMLKNMKDFIARIENLILSDN